MVLRLKKERTDSKRHNTTDVIPGPLSLSDLNREYLRISLDSFLQGMHGRPVPGHHLYLGTVYIYRVYTKEW